VAGYNPDSMNRQIRQWSTKPCSTPPAGVMALLLLELLRIVVRVSTLEKQNE
jgi:hypothetical protein